jgi:hypothetical protein
VLSWPPLPPEGFVSHGHGDDVAVTVRVTPEFAGTYLNLVQDSVAPPGTLVALVARDGRVPIRAMQKQSSGEWRYFVVTADGAVQAAGNLASCARCHGEAAADALFGLPRSSLGNALDGGAVLQDSGPK